MRVADYIMQRLALAGVSHLFMVTGRGALYLTDAAARCEKLTCVPVHHEQAGAYAAMAYSQYGNGLGACLVSTGCAGTNAMTGLLCAWQDEIPCVFLSGQNILRETTRHSGLSVRTFGQQETDIVGLVSPITKYAVMIEDPGRLAYEMDKALFLARSGRKGPVWIDVPLDIQNMRVEPGQLEKWVPYVSLPEASGADLNWIREALEAARRPVLLIGSAIRSSGAIDAFRLFVERHCLPVTYANSAVDIYSRTRALSLGAVGTMGANRAANFAIQNADLVLVLGNRLNSITVGNEPDKFARAAKIAVVDIDSEEPKKNTVRIDKLILSDVKQLLERLNSLEDFTYTTPEPWLEKCLHWKKLFPLCDYERRHSEGIDLYYLAECLAEQMTEDAVLVCDAGLEELILPTNTPFHGGQRCLHPASQGAMGYALPASVGAWLAGKKQTAAVVGDGSIMMNIQELQTIFHYNYPIKIFIINNNCYAIINKRQRDLFRTRTVGTNPSDGISCPDFSRIAHCFQLPYEKIESALDLSAGLKKVLSLQGPVLCEVMGLEAQTYLHSSFTRSSTGKFVRRPLEDQSPFLDRETFLSEMIIEPIDQ